MTDQEVLTKAIEIARANGWKKPYMPFEVDLSREIYLERDVIELWDDWVDVEHVLFDHDFAKALWGEEPEYSLETRNEHGILTVNINNFIITNWQYHLQQMAIAKNRIEYLKEHLPQ